MAHRHEESYKRKLSVGSEQMYHDAEIIIFLQQQSKMKICFKEMLVLFR